MSSVSPPEPRAATVAVDCDVHVSVPSAAALAPHLPAQWADYIGWTNFKPPGGVAFNYPGWAPMFRSQPPVDAFETIRSDVLGQVDRAILQCYFGVDGVGNPYLASALAGGVNRWLASEWLDRDERLLATAAITPQHAPQAVEEIERVAQDGRFVGVLAPARSKEPYGNQRYWPIWEAAAEHDLVVVLAYGGVPEVRWTPSFFEDYVLITQAFQTQISSLVMCGVFDRWPNLRVTVAESGWTWLPSLFWRMDQEWKAYDTEVPWLREAPSDYVRRHFRFTTQPVDVSDAAALAEILSQIAADGGGGHDLLLHGSDHPHRYGPQADEVLACLADEQRDQVLRRNACEWYRGMGAQP
jgi:predicted TIM-barrel fold metal-dependent hydrolase